MIPCLLALGLLATPSGQLVVDSPHYGAVVIVDRQPVGAVPLAPLTLSAGLHMVEATSPGRPRWQRLVFVPAGGTARARIRWRAPARTTPLPTASRDTPPQGPRTDLHAHAGIAGAHWRGAHDLDLRLGWALEATDGPWRAVTHGAVDRDLTGGRLLRRVSPERSARVRLETAWVERATARGAARIGRLHHRGPVGWARVVDGARLSHRAGAHALHLEGGRRAAVVGRRPSQPWLVHAGWQRDGLSLGGWFVDDLWITAARAHVRAKAWTLRADAHHTGLGLGRLAGMAEWAAARWRWHLGGALDHTNAGPWAPLQGTRLFEPDQARFAAALWGAEGWLARWRWSVDGAMRWAAARRQHRASAHLERRWGRVDAAAYLDTLAASGPPAPRALRGAIRAGLRARARLGPIQLEGAGGAARLSVGGLEATQPEGRLRLRWAWTPELSLAARLGVEAVHPRLGDGRLTTGGLEVVLR